MTTHLSAATQYREICRQHGIRVGFTNGCFDLLHEGHTYFLRSLRMRCERIIVGLNSNASVERLKGPDRPVQDASTRALALLNTKLVGLIVPFDEDTPEKIIRALRPDVLAKGDDYAYAEIVGAEFVQSYGGEVFRIPRLPGISTTALINKNPTLRRPKT